MLLIVCGLLVAGFGALWWTGAVPGSRTVLPAPVALARPTPTPTVAVQPTASAPTQTTPTAVPIATRLAVPTPRVVQLVAADAEARTATLGGYAARLTIPSIKVDTPVEQAGIVLGDRGEPIWETRPFVAVHYGDLTGLLGQRGNAVIAGHVVTVSEGNVFRFLYQLEPGDDVHIWDQLDREFDYQVAGIRLVPPSDTSVMQPTADQTLTLITCGGEFDPRTREFSARLIVTAHPV